VASYQRVGGPIRTKVGRQIDRNQPFSWLIGGKSGIERQNWTMSDSTF
jgi:hypothetical protein